MLRSKPPARATTELEPALPDLESSDPSESDRSGLPHELLLAWVQFLKGDIMSVANTLNNRLNVIANAVSEAKSEELDLETKQVLFRIKSECDRAAKITSGLLHRVHALAPDQAPKALFEFDGSTLPSCKILLVEDDDSNRTAMSMMFRRLGQEVTPVKSAHEAYAAMEVDEPDCIISDVKLPYMGGRTLFEQVEERKPHLASRFLFVTGDYSNPETVDFLQTSGQPYVSKPYELDALLGAVAAILRRRIRSSPSAVD